VNFLFICSNIPAAPTYGVYISQLIRYSTACGSYQDFLDRGFVLTRKLLKQGFLLVKSKSSLRSFTVATMTWSTVTEHLCHKWPRICSTCRKQFPIFFSFMTCHVTRVTRRVPLVKQDLSILPEHLGSPPVFRAVCVTRSLVLYVMVCRSIVVCPVVLSFGHCALCSSIYRFWLPLWYLQTLLL